MATAEYVSKVEWPINRTEISAGQSIGRLKLLKVGDVRPSGRVENRVLMVMGSSPRVYYTGPSWGDVEFSAEIKFVNNMEQSYLVGRSNHEIRPCGFGGYDLFVDLKDQKIFFKKEISHKLCNNMKGYSSRLKSVSVDVKEDIWFKQKLVVTNIEGDKVKLEGFFNGEKKNELIDDGNIKCKDKNGNKVATPAFTGKGKWCYTRANAKDQKKAGEIRYKNLSIKPL